MCICAYLNNVIWEVIMHTQMFGVVTVSVHTANNKHPNTVSDVYYIQGDIFQCLDND